MPSASVSSLLKLPASERAELAMALWDSLTDAEHDAELALTSEQAAELDRRWADHVENPASAIPWAEVRRKLQGGRWSGQSPFVQRQKLRRLSGSGDTKTDGLVSELSSRGLSPTRLRDWPSIRQRFRGSTGRCGGRFCGVFRTPFTSEWTVTTLSCLPCTVVSIRPVGSPAARLDWRC